MYNFGMDNFNNLTLSIILQEEKVKNKSICTYLSNELKKYGFNLTPRHIQRFKSGEYIPSYEIIEAILTILGISFSSEDIKKLSDNSKNYKMEVEVDKTNKPSNVNADSIKITMSLTTSDLAFLQDYMDESLTNKVSVLKILKDRVEDDFGRDKNSYKRYILDLIKKDMKGELR